MDASKFRVMLLLFLTFVAGAAAGIAGERLDLLPGLTRAEGPSPDRRDDDRRGRQTTIERFADELGLSTAQRAEIDQILERYRSSMKGLWEDVRPRYRALVDSVRARIEEVLTPEQVTEYRRLLERRRDGDRDGDRGSPDGEDEERDEGRSDDDGR